MAASRAWARLAIRPLLMQIGDVAAAIAYCVAADEKQRNAIFDIARRLGDLEDPAGRRLFDQAETRLFAERAQSLHTSRSDMLPDQYLRAALRFRPLDRIFAQLRKRPGLRETDDTTPCYHDESEWWRDYGNALSALVEECSCLNRHDDLLAIADQCADGISAFYDSATDPDRAQHYAVWLQEAGVAAIRELIQDQAESSDLDDLLGHLLMRIESHTSLSTALTIAEILHSTRRIEAALDVLELLGLNQQIAAVDLDHDGRENTIHRQFRYWLLVYLCKEHFTELPVSVPPNGDTPAGNSVTAGAPLHSLRERIRMASLVENNLHELAQLLARIVLQDNFNENEAALTLRTCLKSIRFPHLHDHMDRWTASGIRRILAPLIAEIAGKCGERVASSVAELFGQLFNSETHSWPLPLQLDISNEVRGCWRYHRLARLRLGTHAW